MSHLPHCVYSGTTYQGTWHGLEVAIKRVILQVLADSASQAKLRTALREAAINSTLDHPNIVSTYTYNMQRIMGEAQVSFLIGRNNTIWLAC